MEEWPYENEPLSTTLGLQSKTLALIIEGVDGGIRRACPGAAEDIDKLIDIFKEGVCIQHQSHFFSQLTEVLRKLETSLKTCESEGCGETDTHEAFKRTMELIITAPQDVMELRMMEYNM